MIASTVRKTKGHHIVPQFYLRYFTSNLGAANIWRFRKSTGEVRNINIRRAAVLPNYYDALDVGGNPATLEESLSHVEDYFSVALKAVVDNPTPETLLANREEISEFLACQAHRSPLTRNRVARLAQGTLRANGTQYSDEDIVRMHLAVIVQETPKLAGHFLKMSWLILHNSSTDPYLPFWISDYPFYRATTEETRESSVFAPLTPNLTLMMHEGGSLPQGTLELQVNGDLVRTMNSSLVQEAWREVYSPDWDFTLAQELIQNYPEMADPNRERTPILSAEPD